MNTREFLQQHGRSRWFLMLVALVVGFLLGVVLVRGQGPPGPISTVGSADELCDFPPEIACFEPGRWISVEVDDLDDVLAELRRAQTLCSDDRFDVVPIKPHGFAVILKVPCAAGG